MNTKVIGVGRYIPEKKLSSLEVEKMAGFEKFKVRHGLCKMLTGCESRYYSGNDEFSSSIAAKAALEAISDAGIKKETIDAVIFCSVTQDFAEPATVNVVMDLLGIRNAFGFDVKNACNAFITGLDLADSLIKTEKAKTILVVSGEALSKWINFKYDNKESLMQTAPVTLSIGDGGGAFILQGVEENNVGIQKSIFRTFPEFWNNNVVWGGGVVYPQNAEYMYIPGTTKVIVDKQRELWTQLLSTLEDEFGWNLHEDIDYYVPTQVAKWINQNIANEFNIPMEKMVQVVDKFGNVGASNIPIAFVEALKNGKIKRGDKILMAGVGVGINLGAIAMIY